MTAIQIADSFDSFAIDHTPDGWPAVQQKQLTEAAAELRRLEAQLQKETAARQAAQIEAEALKERLVRADAEKCAAVLAERIAPNAPVQEPIGYLAFRDGKPSWDEDCVCEDAVYPVDADDDRVSVAIYTAPQPDRIAQLEAANTNLFEQGQKMHKRIQELERDCKIGAQEMVKAYEEIDNLKAQMFMHEPVTDEENERFSRDVSNFKGSDPEATKYALEAFLRNRVQTAPVQEPVAWWKQYPDGSISVVESRTFLAEDAVAMGWRALGFTDVAPQAQQPAPPAEVPLLTDAVRYKKLRRWMSSNVKEGWEEVERMGAVASWVGWDDFDAYLDALPECAVGLVSPPVSTEAASQKAGQK